MLVILENLVSEPSITRWELRALAANFVELVGQRPARLFSSKSFQMVPNGVGDRLGLRLSGQPRQVGCQPVCFSYFSTTRVDSRGLRGTPVDSTAADKRLKSNVLDHKLRVVSQLPKHARTGSNPCASTTDPPLPLYEECFHCTSIVQGSVRLSAGRRAGPHARGSTGTSCAAVRLSCASVRPPRVRVAGRRSIVVR